MHTGDAGYFKPSGQLVVIDRMRDLATAASGERFSPQYIENKLKFSPYISEAVVLGDQRDYRRDRLHPLCHRLQVGRAEPHVVHDLL